MKTINLYLGIIIFCTVFFRVSIVAQVSHETENGSLSKVFVIGDFQEQYESLFTEYPDILIVASQNNIDSAHQHWVNFMQEMEAYSKTISFDLEGVIMWIHFFWAPDGAVAHVAYHLQPQSRFVKEDSMQAFLRSFARNHTIDVKNLRGFNHYGSVSFPLYYKRSQIPK